MKTLAVKFENNNELQKQNLPGIKARIDWAILNDAESLEQFIDDLKADNIELVIRRNAQRIIYGLTYVDLNTKTVANGSDLGHKAYSAKGILAKFGQSDQVRAASYPGKEQSNSSHKKWIQISN